MSNFLFDGRSRPNRMQLVSDNPQSKEKLLQEARRRQQKREEDRRRGQAASRIQRAVRQLLAQQRLLCLALGVLDALPAESDSSASPLTPKELGTACWSFQCVRDHVAKLPTTAFLSAEGGNEEEKRTPVLTKAERIARAHGVVRRCSGKLVTAVRVVLQRGARAREGQGNFVDLLTELPPAAAGFLALVLLEDYSASLAEKNGSGAERAFRGLDELCRAAVSAAGVTNSSSSPPQREAVQDSRAVTLLVSIVSSCLAYAAAHPELQQSARSRLVGLLTPLVPLCAPAVALPCSAADTTSEGEARADLAAAPQQANDNEEEGETEAAIAATLPSPEDTIRSQAWADGCWASLTSSCDDGYLSLTGNPIAALLSAHETKTSSPTDAAATTSLLMVLQVAYDRIVRDSFMDGTAPSKRGREPEVHASPSPTTKAAHASPEAVAVVANARWWETSAMTVLGRLTRMLPLLLSREGVDAADAADDSDGAAVARRLARVVWLRCVGALCERLCQTESFTQGILFDLHHSRLQLMSSEGEQQQQEQEQQQRGGAAVANAHCGGKYRALASYLFSSEGGLRLMEQLATASGEDEDGGADRDTYRARMPQHFFPANEEAQLLSLNVLESICGVYAWPLFTFSLSSPQNRLETSAVFAKLVHTPQLLRQLWCLYRSRCDGLAALLPAGELLEKLCRIATTPNVAVRMPVWRQPPPSLLAAKGLRGRQGMFWDPNPAFAALFFTLLGYYIDVTDFTQELQRGTVFTEPESWALILALKEIVHRAHFHGVVPGENCEAVAHVAYILLAKLHVINESSMFVPYPSLWISTADPSTMHVLGNITGDQWDTLSEKRVGEQRRLEHKLDGLGEDDGASASGDDDEEGESSGKTAGGLLATAHFLSAKNNPAKAKAAAAAAAARVQRCPGSDIVFDDSANWPLEERIVRLLLHTPFTVPFPERAALLTMFLLNTQPSRAPGRPRFFVVHRGRTFVDTFERFHNHPDSADMYSVRFAAAARDRQSGRAAGGNNNAVRRAQDAVRRAFFGNPEDEDGEDMDDVMGDLTGQAGQRPPANPEDGTELPDEGLEEGYGQGVYRELMVSVCKEGFDASHGLFLQTEDGYVYPNPFSFEATGDPLHVEKIRFLGTMVGRAFRDGILQDYPFALHFRNALLGRRNSINNLRSYDAQLYQQLMSLGKMSREELESMGLTFTYDVNALGITREVELIKGGATIPVTQTNCLHYIQLVADFKLNREGAQQMQAFRVGLEAIIKPSWLQLFDSNELLNLLGGDQTGRIDLADWRKHATYYPPEAANSEPVRIFWEVVTSLTNEQQSKLLKFATSMNRPPLLGFRFLSPPFNIHMLSEAAIDRLPSASTCFSMLKLPPYRDYATARAKIIAAIEETNSFGLT